MTPKGKENIKTLALMHVLPLVLVGIPTVTMLVLGGNVVGFGLGIAGAVGALAFVADKVG